MSIILLKYFCKTEIPSGWQAQSSKMRAIDLYSDYSIGKLTIVLIRGLKISDLMNHMDRLSYISLSLKSRTISMRIPIRF
jgi:hypothetical protein